MKQVGAGKFKDQCLKIMDEVSTSKTPVVVTKRKKPMVRVIPYAEPENPQSELKGSILKEKGSPFRTGEDWDADLP